MHLIEQYSLAMGARINKPFIETSYYPLPFERYIVIENGFEVKSRIYGMWPDIIASIKPDLDEKNIFNEIQDSIMSDCETKSFYNGMIFKYWPKITFDEMTKYDIEGIKEKRIDKKNSEFMVAITFDDTFKNVKDVALPILKKYLRRK